ncbi:hypothetical protein E8E12_010317 [Didymella heteroderae]|uniref:Uncharacterized protein n=1 Tax=Didymella heteroderae TaxID=1769908 RepID=A0A9P4X1L8_9PLEO|nr:hypothetical protein E8E12_010317 [Didymella heteroderae]
MSMEDLRALPVLTDKYNLIEVVRVMLELKKWLDPYKQEWKKTGFSSMHLAEFAEMHRVFGNQDDYKYVFNRFAVEVEADDEGFLTKGSDGEWSKLSSGLPERIVVEIKETRRLILSEWVDCIDAAVNMALGGITDPANNPFYWKGLKDIGSDLKSYGPCDKTYGYGKGAHYSKCSFEACFGDFGFIDKAKKILKEALHRDFWCQLQNAEYLQAVAKYVVTMTNASSSAASIKRKRTDPNLKTIILDSNYDLVLIVGTPTHPDGQKAFCVNKGSMRDVSDIWTKMLTGDWAESKKSETEFPDDSWRPFEIVLKIAHMKVKDLPTTLSFECLQDLATLTDKYNLTSAVRMGLELKNWLHMYQDEWTKWPSPQTTQHFPSMASVFKYDADLVFLTSKLAVETWVVDGHYLFYENFAAKAALPSSERKLDLETISIEHYDLTLIFGTPEYEDGHKAFRVSRSTVRLVSDVWSEMLVGRWADASQAEIRLPDDSCKAGEIVMRIAHWQISLLPSTVPFVDFRELVMLTDKYNIGQAVRLAVASKKWLAPHKAAWRAWFHCTELQDFALMALVFGDESGFEFIAQRLAVEIECKTDDGTDTWWNGKEGSKVELESSLPDRILQRFLSIA